MCLHSTWDVGQWPGEHPWEFCGPYRDDRGYRWVVVAAVILLLFGVTNLVEGLAAVGNPRFFVSHPYPIVRDLTPWGFVTPQYVPGNVATRGWMGVIARLAGVAVGFGALGKNQLSRWMGVAFLGLEAIGQLPRMRDDRLMSVMIFTLGRHRPIRPYRVREANPHASVLPRLGRCRGWLRLDAGRTIAAPRLGINRLRWSRERDRGTANMVCVAALRAECDACMVRMAGWRLSQCDGSVPPLPHHPRRGGTGRDGA
jgi:hypothetical protein